MNDQRSADPPSRTDRVDGRRSRATLPAMRDLDYANWHAHIAGIASPEASTRLVPGERPAQVRELAAAATRSEQPAA